LAQHPWHEKQKSYYIWCIIRINHASIYKVRIAARAPSLAKAARWQLWVFKFASMFRVLLVLKQTNMLQVMNRVRNTIYIYIYIYIYILQFAICSWGEHYHNMCVCVCVSNF
jgi:hypothetical protein